MKKIKTLKGTNLLSDMVIDLYPSSLKFYSDKYKTLIDDTLSKTILYEWNKESAYEVMCDITNRKLKQSQVKSLTAMEDKTYGFHYVSTGLSNNIKHFVVVKNRHNENEMKASLAHELYGHAVCSNYKTYQIIDGYLCMRNGICLNNLKKNEFTNRKASEGMIEYIASQIMYLHNPKFKRPNDIYVYDDAVEVARQLFKYVGKEKMLELLVHGNGSIEKIFDKDNIDSWRNLASELEKKEPDIDEYLDGFVKRYKYGNR